eukprot:Colp12_sorted_trinity150504_noHs@4543
MDFLFGLVGDGYTLLCADKNTARSICVMKTDSDKMFQLSKRMVMVSSGEPGDNVQFPEYIEKNIKLYEMKNGISMSTHAAANYTRGELASSLRSRDAYAVNLLLGGFDNDVGPSLYWLDYLGALVKVPFAAHGYGSYFTLSVLDRHYKQGLSLEEGKEVLRKAISELQKRFMVNLPKFTVRVITAEGVTLLEDF